MKRTIFAHEQGSPEWFACRMGCVTASEFKTVLAKGEGKTRRTYMLKLIGERLTGDPCESYSNGHMERGHLLEPEAREMYCLMHDCEVQQVGFIKAGDDVGYSPDSTIGESGLLEVKTKLPHLQLDVLLRDAVPTEHMAQIQGGMWVAEREWLDFVSYWPKLPIFVKRVYRDEKYIATIKAAVDAFIEEMHELTAEIQN